MILNNKVKKEKLIFLFIKNFEQKKRSFKSETPLK